MRLDDVLFVLFVSACSGAALSVLGAVMVWALWLQGFFDWCRQTWQQTRTLWS